MDVTLAIVCCGPQLEVALSGESLTGISLVRLAGRTPRSTLLLAAADLLVEDSGIDRKSVARVAVTRGPGSFTGIRSGLATAQGLAAALGIEVLAVGSLTVQAARVEGFSSVWAAQPGRRGEVYAREFSFDPGGIPRESGEVRVVAYKAMSDLGPWICPEGLAVDGIERVRSARTAAEALLFLAQRNIESGPVEPCYVEGPPIHGRSGIA